MSPEVNELYEFGPFRVDSVRRLLFRENQPVPLTSKAFDTLLVLVTNRGRVLEKEQPQPRLAMWLQRAKRGGGGGGGGGVTG